MVVVKAMGVNPQRSRLNLSSSIGTMKDVPRRNRFVEIDGVPRRVVLAKPTPRPPRVVPAVLVKPMPGPPRVVPPPRPPGIALPPRLCQPAQVRRSTRHPPNGPPPMRLLVKYHGVPKSIFILSKNLTLTDLQRCVLDWTIQQDPQDF